MHSNVFYDESIFTNGVSYMPYKTVTVFNNADAYLVGRLGLKANRIFSMETRTEGNDIEDALVINLNPRTLGYGINMFSMNWANKRVKETVKFNPISVMMPTVSTNENVKPVPIFIGEHITGTVYTVNSSLCSFQSAIMIKYFAVHHKNVQITERLHSYIRKHFAEQRQWFVSKKTNLIRQNHHHELIQNNKVINTPIVTIYGPEVSY